ncbi:hypothetical protein [Streptomyces albiaxialis]|uniref:hypothetical protein n=1 Tax=Streptomyces albiaxialis TaxID=329523 RepID=UPI0031D7C4A7
MTSQSSPSRTPCGSGLPPVGGDQADGRGDDVVPAAEDLAVLLVVRRREDGLDELADDVEGGLLLLFAAARVQNGAVVGGGAGACLAEEGGLARAGRSGEGDDAAGPYARGGAGLAAQLGQPPLDGGEFRVPLQQCRARRCRAARFPRHILVLTPSGRCGREYAAGQAQLR